MNKRFLGKAGEELACNYLINKGNTIIRKNYQIRDCEIDIIFSETDKDTNVTYLVFCEVKYRSSMKYGAPYEAVDLKKIRKICKAAKYFLYSNKI